MADSAQRKASTSALLESYAAGRWFRATDEGAPLLDAATGEEVARISSTGRRPRRDDRPRPHRRRPGAAGADLPRARRAAQGDWPSTSTELKDELYALSAAHRRDQARLDGRHRRRHRHRVLLSPPRAPASCPTTRSSSTVRLEQLGRQGTFLGQHVYTSRPGVAVQINAFNFPVWGMLEKLAPAFLAGLPTHREAGQPDGVPHRAGRTPDHRVRPPPRGHPAAALRQPGRPARGARRPGLRRLHRLRRTPAPTCASTRRCCTAASSSASRPTR